MNKTILIGRLTKDPELRATQTGKSVCSFTLAVENRFDKENTLYINIVAWGKTGEIAGKYLHKGSKACIVGAIQARSYEAKDGTKRYITEINAEEIEFLDSKDKTEKTETKQEFPGFTEILDSDLPF